MLLLLESVSERKLLTAENTSLCEALEALAGLGNVQNSKARNSAL